MSRWRVSPGTALLGAACSGVAAAVWVLLSWTAGVACACAAICVLATSLSRHPAHEEHTGPFARCTGPQPVLRDDARSGRR